MFLDLFPGPLNVLTGPMSRPASTSRCDQNGRGKECKHESFDHNLCFFLRPNHMQDLPCLIG